MHVVADAATINGTREKHQMPPNALKNKVDTDVEVERVVHLSALCRAHGHMDAVPGDVSREPGARSLFSTSVAA